MVTAWRAPRPSMVAELGIAYSRGPVYQRHGALAALQRAVLSSDKFTKIMNPHVELPAPDPIDVKSIAQ